MVSCSIDKLLHSPFGIVFILLKIVDVCSSIIRAQNDEIWE
jgi:hypothetical protein